MTGFIKKDVFNYSDIDLVKRNIKKFKLKNTYVFKAYFPKNIKVKIRKIKLCHIDVNTYYDTKVIFTLVNKKIIKGGIVIFDDFGIWGVDGIKKFIYNIEKKYSKKYHFIKNYMGQCILIKVMHLIEKKNFTFYAFNRRRWCVEKNFFIITNFLATKFKKIYICNSYIKNKPDLKKNVIFFDNNKNTYNNLFFIYLNAVVKLIKFLILNKDVTVLSFQANTLLYSDK